MTRSIELNRHDAERFWSRVDRADGDDCCWIWTGMTDGRGGGMFNVAGVRFSARRVAFALERRAPLLGQQRLHRTCGEPGCVRPTHAQCVGTAAKQNGKSRSKHHRADLFPPPAPEPRVVRRIDNGDCTDGGRVPAPPTGTPASAHATEIAELLHNTRVIARVLSDSLKRLAAVESAVRGLPDALTQLDVIAKSIDTIEFVARGSFDRHRRSREEIGTLGSYVHFMFSIAGLIPDDDDIDAAFHTAMGDKADDWTDNEVDGCDDADEVDGWDVECLEMQDADPDEAAE